MNKQQNYYISKPSFVTQKKARQKLTGFFYISLIV